MVQYSEAEVDGFSRILARKQRTKRTIHGHANLLRRFLKEFDGKEVGADEVQGYLSKFGNRNTYRNNLSTLKVYFRECMKRPDIMQDFTFPAVTISPKSIPDKRELRRFYGAIDDAMERALFLMFASSGLRRQELLDLKMGGIDLKKRMLMPKAEGDTKHTWVSFYNPEAEAALREYLEVRGKGKRLFVHSEKEVKRIWGGAREKTGLSITPQVLREWFAEEMSNLRVPERYIDAFCGRVPRSVLARHYSDYRPNKLKRIYDKAGIRVLS